MNCSYCKQQNTERELSFMAWEKEAARCRRDGASVLPNCSEPTKQPRPLTFLAAEKQAQGSRNQFVFMKNFVDKDNWKRIFVNLTSILTKRSVFLNLFMFFFILTLYHCFFFFRDQRKI